jgi:hypothetical protein
MRSLLLCLATLLTVAAATPARSQWTPDAPYTFTRGQTYSLTFDQPGTDSFEAAQFEIWYPTAVFDPIALLTSATPSVLSVEAGPIDTTLQNGTVGNVVITVMPPLDPPPQTYGITVPAGPLIGVQFLVKGIAPLGLTNVRVDYTLDFAHPTNVNLAWSVPGTANIQANIVAIPEPESWALMLAGLALVGGAALRARRQA